MDVARHIIERSEYCSCEKVEDRHLMPCDLHEILDDGSSKYRILKHIIADFIHQRFRDSIADYPSDEELNELLQSHLKVHPWLQDYIN